MADVVNKISSKSNKRYRRKKSSSESEEEDETQEQVSTILEDAKELQKMRKRQNGISASALALGTKIPQVQEFVVTDPFKLKTGGLVDMKQVKDRNRDRSGEEEDDTVNLGTTFSAETNRRDEDADMMKYIEEQLALRKGVKCSEAIQEMISSTDEKIIKPEDALFELPEYLRKSSSKKSEEMLSNQMLSGIPEVDLGIEAKIRNIEATEDAKQKLMAERLNKKDKPSEFVPSNMAVNFVQHNRFNIEETESGSLKKEKDIPKRKPVVVGDADNVAKVNLIVPPPKKKSLVDEKATDDFHFEKFKKQFRRY